jgi:hypothetical protein
MGLLEILAAMPPRADAPRSPAPDPYAFGDLTTETARRAYEEMLALAGMGGQATRSMLPESVNQYVPDWLAQGGDYGLAGLTGLLGAAETGAGALGEGVEAFQRGIGMDGRYAPGGSARALQADLMGMLEGSGFAPEGRMVAGLADAAGPLARAGLLDMIPNEYGGVPLSGRTSAPFDMGGGIGAPPAVVKMKKGAPRPEAAPAGPFAPSTDPRYFGAAPDRSELSFLRYQPKKSTPRVAKALAALRDPANPVRADMLDTIQRGISPEIRGQDWYNTEELRDWFVSELGDEAGNAEWSQFMDLMGAGSPMSNVPSNIKSASAMRNRLATDPAYRAGLDTIETLDEARVYGKQRPAGYGHQSQGLQELIHARQRQGAWAGAPEPGVSGSNSSMTDNPKPKGFTNSLKGNARNIAADLHFTRYMAMASKDPDFLSLQAGVGAKDEAALLARFPKAQPYIQTKEVKGKPVRTFNVKKAVKDGAVDFDGLAEFDIPALYAEKPNDAEYADFENFMKEIGDEIGLTPAQTQAALWMGAGDKTGLAESSKGTFMDLFRRRVGERAGETGRTFDDTLRDFIHNKGLLALPGAALGGGLLAMQPEQERY